METELLPKRVRFVFPFTILTKPGMVRLVAGEEFRYTFRAPALELWLPEWLQNFERDVEWRPLLNELPRERRQAAEEIVGRLYGERVLLEGTVESSPGLPALHWVVEGGGELSDRFRASVPPIPSGTSDAVVFCQGDLDYSAALDFNRRCLQSNKSAWLWISCGPLSRGFVSPVFRADTGPCLGCLTRNFQRLSPAPEIYDHLIEHSLAGGKIAPVSFPAPAIDMLTALARWKLESLPQAEPSLGVYRLHVLEIGTMACTTHKVFRDPHCPDCRPR